ncbi:unnamed protein product [Owenia fusiformis]|uniref:Uncharacterized protein n=1 Tax=Owenia fusiformis TaxID=6347 RepID=A0A8J1UUA2_OWEFU|nr:unnamed protein product [Owenia fusiformis]
MAVFKGLSIPSIDISEIDFTKSSDDITIEEYFTKEELSNISAYERFRFRNIKQNYLMMMKIGIPIIKPDFMKNKRGRKRPPPPPSDSSSDEEWLPSKERQRDRPKRAIKPYRPFIAPFKVPQKRQQKVPTAENGAIQKKKAKPSATITTATIATKDNTTKASATKSTKPEKPSQPVKPKKSSPPLVLDFLGYDDVEIKKWRKVCMLKTNKIKAEIELLENDKDQALLELVEMELQKEEEAELAKREREAPRYPKRNIERTNYKLLEVPDDDEFLFCEDCNLEHKGDCPIHGPLIIVEDRKVEGGKFRAELTAPYDLVVRLSKIPGAGHGVWTTAEIPKGVRFGPYAGKIVEIHREHDAHESGYAWMIYKNEKPSHFIDAGDVGQANWMRYVNCARFEGEQNVTAFQYLGQIYYRTFRPIPPNTEVLVWYGESYAEELGIDVLKFRNNTTFANGVRNVNVEKPKYKCMTLAEMIRLNMAEVIKIKCPLCSKQFFNEAKMEEHKRKHRITGSDFNPPDPRTQNTTDDTLHTSKTTHGEFDVEGMFKCDKCDKCFTKKCILLNMMAEQRDPEIPDGPEHDLSEEHMTFVARRDIACGNLSSVQQSVSILD